MERDTKDSGVGEVAGMAGSAFEKVTWVSRAALDAAAKAVNAPSGFFPTRCRAKHGGPPGALLDIT
jgi:hypothetical protein